MMKMLSKCAVILCHSLPLSLQGSPQMLRQQGCVFMFEWATPVVCPDATSTSGCHLTDAQLQYTFDLSSLSGEVPVNNLWLTLNPSLALLLNASPKPPRLLLEEVNDLREAKQKLLN